MKTERLEARLDCPFAGLQPIIRGKWTVIIIYFLSMGTLRFGELSRKLPMVTQAKLTRELRTLEEFGMVHREVYREVPPKVEYSLTDLGKSFIPILKDMKKWSDTHLM